MFIIKERYLEVPNFQNWTEGLYLVDAPCGTGKSYFVFHTLYPFAKENNKKLIVFSNRNALKRQQELQAEGTDTITLYFLRNISSIAARYGKLQKEIQLGNEYLFEREHDVDRFRKVHIKDKLPDFFDNAFGLIEPTWFKAKADYQFYYSLVGAKTPDKGKTTFAKEVSQRLKVRVHYYETVSKNYNLYSYLTKNVDRKYYNKDRKELIDTFGLRKDGHLLKSMGMFNQYLEENQIEYRLKSNKKNNKVYWTIVKTDENERNPLYRVTNDLKGEI